MLNETLDLQTWQNQFCNSIQKNEPSELANQARFSIYKNNVFHSLIEALKAQFPVCKQLVGDDFFNGCAKAYLTKQLPNRADMILIGENFPAFLKEFEHTRSIAYLSHVANLEYTRAKSLHSKVANCITHEALASMDIAVLQQQILIFHPSVFLIESKFSIFSIWKGHQPGQTLKHSAIDNIQFTLIFRDEFRVACMELDQATFTCLSLWQSGQSLIEGIQNTINTFPEFNPTDVIEFTFSNPLIMAVK